VTARLLSPGVGQTAVQAEARPQEIAGSVGDREPDIFPSEADVQGVLIEI